MSRVGSKEDVTELAIGAEHTLERVAARKDTVRKTFTSLPWSVCFCGSVSYTWAHGDHVATRTSAAVSTTVAALRFVVRACGSSDKVVRFATDTMLEHRQAAVA